MVGKLVKNLRNNLRLSQTELGKKCGVSDVFISQIEGGKRLAEIRYGEDFYWRLATLVSSQSNAKKRTLYAQLVLEDLRYRYSKSFDLCIKEIQRLSSVESN